MPEPAPHPLEASWTRLLTTLGSTPGECRQSFADLAARYAEPGRHYHTLAHVGQVLDTLRSLRGDEAGPALLLAAWFHDAVYDTRAADNEERSADHARTVLGPLRLPGHLLDETCRLILLTRTHRAGPADLDGQALLDADLAILGAAEPDYDRYSRAIRLEFAWVPEPDYRAGRARVLRDFLGRPRIYHTETMFTRLEARARLNLERERAALGNHKSRESRE
jgi:predicted metal-dependent HD superfamily phosphohydrolase